MSSEFRLAEKWGIGTNFILAGIGIGALVIYNGQLKQMRKATKATEIAAQAAADNAKAAKETLIEIQSSKKDTLDLVKAAKDQAKAALAQATANRVQAQASVRSAKAAEDAFRLSQELQAAQLIVLSVHQQTGPSQETTVITIANTGHSNAKEVRVRSIPIQVVAKPGFEWDPWKQYESYQAMLETQKPLTPEDEAWWLKTLGPEKFDKWKARIKAGQMAFDSVIPEIAGGQTLSKTLPTIAPNKLVDAPQMQVRFAIVGLLSWTDERSGRFYKGSTFCYEYLPGSPTFGICQKPVPVASALNRFRNSS